MLKSVLRIAIPAIALAVAALGADISGSWEFTAETAQGSGYALLEFVKQKGETLSGTYSGQFWDGKTCEP